VDGGLEGVVGWVRGLAPSCGGVRLVGVDGHAGSGKTTFAARLAAPLAAGVVHLDDLATHEQLFGWVERLRDEVVRPLSRGEPARHRVYDWTQRRFRGERTVPPAGVVLLEGVGAARAAVRPHLAASVWMDVPASVAHVRGRRRDGPAQATFWRAWVRAEESHFAADPSRPFADLLVRPDGEGYDVRRGTRNPA
jgi:uridine kinase